MNQTYKYPCPDGVHSLEKEGRWTLNSRHAREEIIGWKEISALRREKAARKLRLGVPGGGEMGHNRMAGEPRTFSFLTKASCGVAKRSVPSFTLVASAPDRLQKMALLRHP